MAPTPHGSRPMTCQYELNQAATDKQMVEKTEAIMRSYLLMALSEIRATTIGMEPSLRDTLLDGVTKEFHPDANAKDLFADAFHDAKAMADAILDERKDEIGRRHIQAAE